MALGDGLGDGEGVTVGEGLGDGDGVTPGDGDVLGVGEGIPFCMASASLLANSSVNQIRFCESTFKPSCGCPFCVGAGYSANVPVPESGKEPKICCSESSNQTCP